LLASVTGWPADYILRKLPVALGLQMILWHDLKAGRSMRWGANMAERGRGKVDIAAEIQKTLALAHED
jgi:hypothetical protein